MEDGADRYCLANSEIVSDVIDGETVLVDLASGSYYTANPTGGFIWSLVTGGRTRPEVVAELTRHFGGEIDSIRSGCARFIERLCAEGLISKVDNGAGRAVAASAPALPPGPFAEPLLTKYTDMEDLLSLDPIHEVDELGWPHVKPPGGG